LEGEEDEEVGWGGWGTTVYIYELTTTATYIRDWDAEALVVHGGKGENG
jgi:hypothetical protein